MRILKKVEFERQFNSIKSKSRRKIVIRELFFDIVLLYISQFNHDFSNEFVIYILYIYSYIYILYIFHI